MARVLITTAVPRVFSEVTILYHTRYLRWPLALRNFNFVTIVVQNSARRILKSFTPTPRILVITLSEQLSNSTWSYHTLRESYHTGTCETLCNKHILGTAVIRTGVI